ncbi:uncharacterized protein LOC134775852 [Penaeus indicus]|uniref:uncharacterized protein LOC134775852 n=1 Tax=Penaeus indicus TaxID=29960 RepID=UPI00300C0EFF
MHLYETLKNYDECRTTSPRVRSNDIESPLKKRHHTDGTRKRTRQRLTQLMNGSKRELGFDSLLVLSGVPELKRLRSNPRFAAKRISISVLTVGSGSLVRDLAVGMVFILTLVSAHPTFANDTTMKSTITQASSTTQVSTTTSTTTQVLSTSTTTKASITTEASATTESQTTAKTAEMSKIASSTTAGTGRTTTETTLLENITSTTARTAEIPLQEKYSCFANLSVLLYGPPETIQTTGKTTENGGLWGDEGTCANITCSVGEVFTLSSEPYESVGVCCHQGAWVIVDPALDVNETLDHPWAGCYSERVCRNHVHVARDTRVTFPGDVVVWSFVRMSKIDVGVILREDEQLLVLGLSTSHVTFTCHDRRSLMFYSDEYARSVFTSFDTCDLHYSIPLCVPVCKTTGGSPCRFPFVHGGSEHRNCTVFLPTSGPSCSPVYNATSATDLQPCDLTNETSTCGDSAGEEAPCGGGPECDAIVINVTMIKDPQLPDVTTDDVIARTYRVRGCHGEGFKLECDEADQNLWVTGEGFGIYYPSGSKRFRCSRRFGIDSFFRKESSNKKPQNYESFCADKRDPATTTPSAATTTEGGGMTLEQGDGGTTASSTTAGATNTQKTGTATTETKKMGATTTELEKTDSSDVPSFTVTQAETEPVSDRFSTTMTSGTTTESVHTTAFTTVTTRKRYLIDESSDIGSAE